MRNNEDESSEYTRAASAEIMKIQRKYTFERSRNAHKTRKKRRRRRKLMHTHTHIHTQK